MWNSPMKILQNKGNNSTEIKIRRKIYNVKTRNTSTTKGTNGSTDRRNQERLRKIITQKEDLLTAQTKEIQQIEEVLQEIFVVLKEKTQG